MATPLGSTEILGWKVRCGDSILFGSFFMFMLKNHTSLRLGQFTALFVIRSFIILHAPLPVSLDVASNYSFA